MKYYIVILVTDYYDTVETPCLVYNWSGREPFFSPDKEEAEEFIKFIWKRNPKSSYKLVEVVI